MASVRRKIYIALFVGLIVAVGAVIYEKRSDDKDGVEVVNLPHIDRAELSRHLGELDFPALRADLKSRVLLPSDLVRVNFVEESSERTKIAAQLYGVSTYAFLRKSPSSEQEKCLRIYIQGHGGSPENFEYYHQLSKTFLAQGCDVLSMSMLGAGYNYGEASFPTHLHGQSEIFLSAKQAQTHANYAFFGDENNPDADALSLFLSPHYFVIKSLAPRYDDITLMGISGGGWYSVWLGALLAEVNHTISYAGSLPLIYRPFRKNAGDWEQVFSPIYNRIDYWDLYALMMADDDGKFTRDADLVFNNADKCCFSDPYASHFKDIIERLPQLPLGVSIDQSPKHEMNPDLVYGLLK